MILVFLFLSFQNPEIPSALEPWQDWVLHNQEEKLCPSTFNTSLRLTCSWPSRLEISASDGDGTFSQEWEIYAPTHVPLPGNSKTWPLSVSIAGKNIPVMDRGGSPSVFLPVGRHLIKGRWTWDTMPNTLVVPRKTGIVNLQLNGNAVAHPKRDQDGSLWLQTTSPGARSQSDQITLRVFRLVEDRIPTFLRTRIQLDVSGRGREINLGQPLPPGFMAYAITSDIPVRLDENGQLYAQVRAGSWKISLISRAGSVVSDLTLHDPGGEWPQTELWSYSPYRSLRSVTPGGMASVDPSQTEIPADWQNYPGFLANSGNTLKLEEKARGINVLTPEQLDVERALWLDFDGQGWTFRDHISGEVQRNQRLTMSAPYQPGRIHTEDGDQLITVVTNESGNPLPGTELRNKYVEMTAEGRIETPSRAMSAAGWTSTLDDLDITLHLPPGYFLFGALGPDSVSGDWMHTWRLWDFFLVLLISLGAGKLWGRSYGFLALATLVFMHRMDGMSHFLWIPPMALLALNRVLPSGKLAGFTKGAYRLMLIVLVLAAIPFAIKQTQALLFPGLSFQNNAFNSSNQSDYSFPMSMKKAAEAPTRVENMVELEEIVGQQGNFVDGPQKVGSGRSQYLNFIKEDAVDSKVQTGPGMPQWQGKHAYAYWADHSATLSWSGPVNSTENLRLWVFPPALQALVIVVRLVLLVALLMVVCNIKLSLPKSNKALKQSTQVLLLLLLPGILLLAPNTARAQDTPSPQLLEELRKRLLERTDCYPYCANIAAANLNVSGNLLRMTLEVHASENVAIPLPGHPSSVRQGNASPPLHLDKKGVLQVLVPKGVNTFTLAYNLSGLDTHGLTFPLKPKRASWQAPGWALDGIHQDGRMDSQIELRREKTAETRSNTPTETRGGLSSFAHVTRTLTLHHTWNLTTVVQNRNQTPLVTQIPLLPGEKVVTEDIRVEQDHVIVNLPGNTGAQISWNSTIEPTEIMTWSTASDASWTETWQLVASHRWNVNWQGTPTITYFDVDDTWLPSWKPRPGESLELKISRPAPLSGQTLTIDSARLLVKPGQRVTDCTLNLNLRTSIGGEYKMGFSSDIQPQGLTINDVEQTFRQENKIIVVSLSPGQHTLSLNWKEEGGIKSIYKTPLIDLGNPAVNLEIEVRLPRNRWLLWTIGPKVGPVIMFWAVLMVIIFIALALSRMQLSPLKAHEWILLGIGLMVMHIYAAIIPVMWFFAMALRKERKPKKMGNRYNLGQLFLVGLTFMMVIMIFIAINTGLLGMPNMYLANSGGVSALNWYHERSNAIYPRAFIYSLPSLIYHLIMLAWSLWAAAKMISWMKWGWSCFNAHGLWWSKKSKPAPKSPKVGTKTGQEENAEDGNMDDHDEIEDSMEDASEVLAEEAEDNPEKD